MIRIGLVGCGHWGSNYLRLFQFLEQAEIVIACDREASCLERVRRQYPAIQLTQDSSSVLGDSALDAVILATPASTHSALVKESLAKGKHVLVEKPLALEVEEAIALVQMAEHSHRVLMVGHTFLYNPAVRKMKEYIQNGTVGKIYYLQAVRTHLGLIRSDVSSVWDLAPHDVSIFSYLLDREPTQVSAVGTCHLKHQFQDVAFVNLFYDSNIIGNIHISWVDSNKLRQVAVIGSKARILFDDLNPLERLRIFEKGASLDKPYDSFGEFQLLLRDGDILSPKIEPEEPLRNVCLEFIRSIQTGEKPLADGKNGLAVVRAMCAIDESMKREGAPVSLSEIR